jgi:hypothetical protein
MAMIMRRVPSEARSRPALETGRPLICQLGGDSIKDSPSALQSQLLRGRFNISPTRAELLSSLIWGEPA